VANSAARKAAQEFFTVDGLKLLVTSTEQARLVAAARHGVGVFGDIEFWVGKGFEVSQAARHVLHKLDGISYKSGCVVCED
jgi:hypothetical protein